jgi:PKD repeat protein
MRPRGEEQAQPGSRRSRILLIATAALVLGLASSAQATTTNVVPNPGFEQAGCGDTPELCGWEALAGQIAQDATRPHSGSASMSLVGLSGFARATTDPAFCTAIGPGTYAASFWYRSLETGNPDYNVADLHLGANFYSGSGCTGSASSDALSEATPILDDAWHEVTGHLVAPPGTASVGFEVEIFAACDLCTLVWANFDDLDVEAETTSDTTPPETTITAGPSGTTSSTSAIFEFIANEPATFECSLDTAPFAACGSPASYTALAEGSHTFRVRSTDTAGNVDPTPAERSWTVQANTAPVARFTFSCSGLTCSFNGSSSADSDGSIAAYAWNFGDGAGGSGVTASHTYGLANSYTVTLTVTDDRGATASDSKTVNPISLSARGYKLNGLQKADLSWTGASWTSFDVYRNGIRIAIVQTNSYKDNINKRGPGTYTYKVCAPATNSCSNDATVSF